METKKNQLDMLHGPIWNKIPQFALPIAATAILGQLFNAADIAVVGNFTGDLRTVSVAAVSATSAIIGLVVNLFVGISLGANVTIAYAVGQKNSQAVSRAVHTAIIMAVLGGVLAAFVGELAAAPLLGALHTPEEVFPLSLLYLRIYFAGQNFGAAELGRCKRTLALCLAEGGAAGMETASEQP